MPFSGEALARGVGDGVGVADGELGAALLGVVSGVGEALLGAGLLDASDGTEGVEAASG